MTTALQLLTVAELVLTLIGAAIFVVVYGNPQRYRDREMAWHLVTVTAVTGFQALGLLLARFFLVPIAIAEGLATAVVYWRLWLLLRTRRRRPQ